MSKVIDEVVFKKSIEDMLQYLSDNCLYEFVPYDDTEISDLFSLTPEEAQRLSDLITKYGDTKVTDVECIQDLMKDIGNRLNEIMDKNS